MPELADRPRPQRMSAPLQILTLLSPLALLSLLIGLGLVVHVLANEGRGRSARISTVVGLLNLLAIVPMVILALAQVGAARGMFLLVGAALLLVGGLGLAIPRRYADSH